MGGIPSAGIALSRGPVPLRPLRLGEVLDGAVKLYRARFGALFGVSALILGPLLAIQLIRTQNFINAASQVTSYQQLDELLLRLGHMTQIITALRYLVAAPIIAAASVRLIAGIYLGEKVPFFKAIGTAVRKIFILLAVIVLLPIALFGGVIFLAFWFHADVVGWIGGIVAIPLMIWIYILFVFSNEAVIVENVGPIKAIRRSIALAKGNRDGGRIFGTLLVAGLIIGAIGIGVGMLAAGLTAQGPQNFTLAQGITEFWALLAAPFSTAVVVVLYFDQRIRREGFDLALMAQELSPPPGG